MILHTRVDLGETVADMRAIFDSSAKLHLDTFAFNRLCVTARAAGAPASRLWNRCRTFKPERRWHKICSLRA